jgi:hypothetical protein
MREEVRSGVANDRRERAAIVASVAAMLRALAALIEVCRHLVN